MKILLGKDLADELRLEREQVVIALADGNRELSGMPALNSFVYSGDVDHKIYEKNVRFAYVHNNYLKELLELTGMDNTLLFSLRDSDFEKVGENRLAAIDDTIIYLLDKLGPIFQIQPFWQEYAPLLTQLRSRNL